MIEHLLMDKCANFQVDILQNGRVHHFELEKKAFFTLFPGFIFSMFIFCPIWTIQGVF